ncbi:MAG TPA: DUF3536 domain-containing protein [Actinomycetota bacterium]|nr:DUF3536 domain-containing protein [Actinomycetota bacterium]
MAARIAVHGHFYQPPRENPWTGTIEVQQGAAPYRDWNERVHAESYRPNTRVELADGRVVNNFEKLSFNVGPTLLAWMQEADRDTYDAIVGADHGNAMAQAYHHTILPLSPVRDVRTQVRWGLRDFELRFGRRSEGIWLPETAADDRTVDVLIEEGVGFTILAPGQAASDGPLDTTVPYRVEHSDGSGRFLTVMFYDGDISHAIAFDGAARSAEGLTGLFEARSGEGCRLVHSATDGETFGHHQKFSDLGLAYALFVEAPKRGLEVVSYPEFLSECPPERSIRLRPGGTSWSCAHGVGRWNEDCGCSTGGEEGWNQKWRGPLRRALEVIRQAADDVYERAGREVFTHPWGARDRDIDVVSGAIELEEFVVRETGGDAFMARAAALLDLQRYALSMYTSCGWFFNDLAGIETVQVMLYAARTMELLEGLGASAPREEFLSILGEAQSNDPDEGSGAEIFERAVGAAKP